MVIVTVLTLNLKVKEIKVMSYAKALKVGLLAILLSCSMQLHAELRWIDKIIVLVEDDVILDSELERRVTAIEQQIKNSGQQLPPKDAIKKQVLERLIIESIQLQRARRAGVRISDDELNATIKRIADGNNLTQVQLREQLEKDGVKFQLFREDIRNEIMISRVRQGLVSQKVFVSEQEVDDVLKIMEEQGATSIQYKLRHMLISISESATADELDAAREKAQGVIDRFNEGTNFVSMVLTELLLCKRGSLRHLSAHPMVCTSCG